MGKNKGVFVETMEHYKNDRLKLEAAYYLIRNMGGHYSFYHPEIRNYDSALIQADSAQDKKAFLIKKLDSLNSAYRSLDMVKVPDDSALSLDLLVENIDYAFKAWQLPWAKNLTFEQFCRYILPYKVSTEKPLHWRKYFYEKLIWIKDSLKRGEGIKEVCSKINDSLRWFKFQFPFDFPVALDLDEMRMARTGRCSDATNLTVYAMRAMGVPVVVDYTPQWANRSYGHTWNSVLYENGRWVNFQGTETNPGATKIEYDPIENWTFKRAKIYRLSFENNRRGMEAASRSGEGLPSRYTEDYYEDVTDDFIPTRDVGIKIKNANIPGKLTFLCVFNNKDWVDIDWGRDEDDSVHFKKIGTGVLYIGAKYVDENISFVTQPFVVPDSGGVQYLYPGEGRLNHVILKRKYPYNNSNDIKRGDNYELVYWQSGWKSLGIKKATDRYLIYDSVPTNALLLLHDIDRGFQERPFVMCKGVQLFY